MATRIGTPGSDSLVGTAEPDLILARGGDDRIEGREAGDLILAGSGNDTIFGDNFLGGGSFGGPFPPPYGSGEGLGNNLILAGAGDDLVYAGYGADTVFGGAGNDTINGFGVFGGSPSGGQAIGRVDGADWLYGGAGADLILGSGGADHLFGGAGDDRLSGGAGVDTLVGGSGADVFVFGRGSPAPTVDDGVGAGLRDLVLDFHHGQDRIDLTGYLNFFAGPGGPPPAVFLGGGDFTASFALQVRSFVEDGHTVVQFAAPLGQPPDGVEPTLPNGPTGEIELAGCHHLVAADFILA